LFLVQEDEHHAMKLDLSRPRHYMQVSGRLHTSAVLPPGKEPTTPIGKAVGWTPEPVWTGRGEKILDLNGTRTPTPRSSSLQTLAISTAIFRLSFSYFLDNRLTDGGECVILWRRPPFTSQVSSWYSFISIENSSDLIQNLTTSNQICGALATKY
jgi:hypothetical protein